MARENGLNNSKLTDLEGRLREAEDELNDPKRKEELLRLRDDNKELLEELNDIKDQIRDVGKEKDNLKQELDWVHGRVKDDKQEFVVEKERLRKDLELEKERHERKIEDEQLRQNHEYEK